MAESHKDDDAKFNETLKRMLKTPPDPKKEKRPDRSETPHSEEDSENGRDAK